MVYFRIFPSEQSLSFFILINNKLSNSGGQACIKTSIFKKEYSRIFIVELTKCIDKKSLFMGLTKKWLDKLLMTWSI